MCAREVCVRACVTSYLSLRGRQELQDQLESLRREVHTMQHGEKSQLEQQRADILEQLRSEVRTAAGRSED